MNTIFNSMLVILTIMCVLAIMFVYALFLPFKMANVDSEPLRETIETIENELNTYGIVIDKLVGSSNRTNVNSNSYTLRIYAEKQDYYVNVSKDTFDKYDTGDVITFKDKNFLFEFK